MKILFPIGSFYPAQSGGPNNTIFWLAKEIVKDSGNEVTVATFDYDIKPSMYKKFSIIPNQELNLFGIKTIYFSFLKSRYLSPKFYVWMIRNIRLYDFVVLTSFFYPISWFVAICCCYSKTKYAIAPRGELQPNALLYSKRIKKVFRYFLLKLYKKASFVWVTSTTEKNYSETFFKTGLSHEIIPNYISNDLMINMCATDIALKKDILYLGRIHPIKALDNLIKAYIALDKTIQSKHRLLIIGAGEQVYVNYLKQICGDCSNILFLGHKEDYEKMDYFKKSKIFVLPSHSENFGNVIIEALISYTPVIASNKTPWEKIVSYNCGKWVNNDFVSLKNAIQDIIMLSEKEYLNYSLNAIKMVKSEFLIKNNINRVIEILEKYVVK